MRVLLGDRYLDVPARLLPALQQVRARLLPVEVERFRVLGELCAGILLGNLAFLDPLTGLPNRTLLMDRIQHGIEQAKRAKLDTVISLGSTLLGAFLGRTEDRGGEHATGIIQGRIITDASTIIAVNDNRRCW